MTEEQVKAVLSEDYTELVEQTYDIYLLPPGEDPESCQSYLRMRNKDGKYSLMFEVCFISSLLLCICVGEAPMLITFNASHKTMI